MNQPLFKIFEEYQPLEEGNAKTPETSCISNTNHTMQYCIVHRFPYTRKTNFISYTRTFITEGNIMTYLRHPQISSPA